MKLNKLFLIVTMCALSVKGYSQAEDTFRQPYPLGEKLSPTPNFSGEVWFAPLTEKKELNVPMANVTFEPGSRNSWHSHKAGQLLIATVGFTVEQLSALLNIVEMNLGKTYSQSLREVLNQITKQP